ncbi:MAG TPA: hypothetical protein PKE05_04785 [Microthrixaceae bacterium]|nr:hypothetical protein [Microthrixaceae bacterium]
MANTKRTWPKGVAAAIGDPVPAEKLTIVLAGAAGPPQECRVALSAWLCKPSTPEVTFGRVAELAIRYASRLEATGVASMTSATAEDASGFVRAPTRKGAPPSVHTMHLRRTTLRSIYRTLHELGAPCGDPTAFMELPSRWFRAQRPLTNAEIHQLRTAVMTRRGDPPAGAVLLALAEAGASTVELTIVCWADIAASCVALPGGARILPRTVALTDWGAATITQARATTTAAATDLAVSGSAMPPGSQPAQAAMTNRLRQLLRTAELHTDPTLGPRSIRLWAAANRYRKTGRIEDAAHVLGMRSLDACAAAIGI